MKKTITLLFLILTFYSFGQQVSQHSKTDLIVKFKSHVQFDKDNCTLSNLFELPEIDILNRSYGIQEIQNLGNRQLKTAYCLRFKEEQNIFYMVSIYTKTGLFEFVEPNYIGKGHSTIPNDQFFVRQYGLLNKGIKNGSKEDSDIDMELAWDIEQGSASILVAVLDSGLKMDHPEFEGRLWNNEDESPDNNDLDENGFNGDFQGWDFVNVDNDPTDDHGHGTNVTGILGATGDNSIGYAGVDWNCKMMPLKILDNNNSGLYTWWTNAIYYAVDNGARVLNMSVGGEGYSFIMQEAVNYAHSKDVTIIVSMGNNNTFTPQYPAAYDSTIGVGSTNDDDTRTDPFFWNESSGSNYGDHLDVVAPGNFIYGLSYLSNSNYQSYWGGTSQAAPLVAGLSSLLLAQNPDRTPTDIRWLIRDTAEDKVGDSNEDTQGYDIYYGYGRINAYEALKKMTAVSTQDLDQKTELSLFPNPTNGQLNIELSPGINKVSIFNSQGKIIKHYSNTLDLSLLNIDLSSVPNGVYLVQALNTNDGQMTVKKVIVQK